MTTAGARASRLLLAAAILVLGAVLSSAARAQAYDTDRLEQLSDSLSSAQRAAAVTRGTPALSGPVDPEHYVLGPGDILSLEFAGRAFGSQTMIVDSEGKIRAPSIGIVTVGGMTLHAAREKLLHDLYPYFPRATLDLRLIQPRTFAVYVLGEVVRPSLVKVIGSARVMEAVDLAGGVGPDGSSRNISILRSNGTKLSADLDRFLLTGELEGNPLIQDGDRIVVPRRTQHIEIFGAVSRPGTMEYHPTDSLGTVVRLAGDTLAEARTDSVLIVRFRGARTLDSLHVDLGAIRRGTAHDIPIFADDRIFVRSIPEWRPAREVVIRGEVLYPGVYPIEEGKSRISDLVRWAGGFTTYAAPKSVRLERTQKPRGEDIEFDRLSRLSRAEMTNTEYQTFRTKLALRQSTYLVDFANGTPTPTEANVPLRDGDQIDVPRLELAVRVDGSVRRPGLVDYVGPEDVWHYIALAGGPTKRADQSDVRLTRASTGTTQFAHDVRTVEPGDFIWVPEKKDTSFWSVFKDVMAVAGQAAAVLLLFHTVTRP